MSRQNIYDDPRFYDGYTMLRASGEGLNEPIEHWAIDAMLSPLAGLDVLDVGCGCGDRTIEYAERGANLVVGIDPSARMLADAEAHDAVDYQRCFIEDVQFDEASFDIIVASMSLHYVENLEALMDRMAHWLRPGGSVVASVEHPIVSCRAEQEWCAAGDHWPVDHYNEEGMRQATWFVDYVVRYHRSVSSWVNAVLDAGLVLTGLAEPYGPGSAGPNVADAIRRPPILVLRGTRPERRTG
ncbi:MAG: class I SAM-dependent methyltransferase [Acidimicrobiales bacterium]